MATILAGVSAVVVVGVVIWRGAASSPPAASPVVTMVEDWASEASASAVMSDLNAGFELGVSGTPTFLVNGRKSVGVLDSLSFTDIYRDIRR